MGIKRSDETVCLEGKKSGFTIMHLEPILGVLGRP